MTQNSLGGQKFGLEEKKPDQHRENIRCESVSMKCSADATGSLEVEITLQICPKLGRRGPGLHILVLNIDS